MNVYFAAGMLALPLTRSSRLAAIPDVRLAREQIDDD